MAGIALTVFENWLRMTIVDTRVAIRAEAATIAEKDKVHWWWLSSDFAGPNGVKV